MPLRSGKTRNDNEYNIMTIVYVAVYSHNYIAGVFRHMKTFVYSTFDG